MNMIRRLLFILCMIPSIALAESSSPVPWEPWSDGIFERATKENKLVLLDLEAIWCHWCHVMDKTTYRDDSVVTLLKKHYIAVKVDQDSRPDLSSRYKEYGWPATIVFSPSGVELAKRSGYIEPDDMRSLLSKLQANPTPLEDASVEIEYASSPELSASVKKKLTQQFYRSHDDDKGGLTLAQKFLDPDSVEYALLLASRGESRERSMAMQTLDANLSLIDPVWGGVYQYSTHYGWDKPHFEKIMSTQTNNLKMYALAYGLLQEQEYLDAAMSIVTYLEQFLKSPEGAFYTSQDADYKKGVHSDEYFSKNDAGRRAMGIPAVDKSIYARENGWVIQSLLQLYNVTGEDVLLQDSLAATRWIEKHRQLPGGGFRHGTQDKGGPFLGDTLAMFRAYIALYTATGENAWMSKAAKSADFIKKHFLVSGTPGFVTANYKADSPLKPVRRLDENIKLARSMNLLYHYTGDKKYLDLAKKAMQYIATDRVALATISEPGILLAAEELAQDPVHITIVGAKDDTAAANLHKAALTVPRSYLRVDWWDRDKENLPNQDVSYPKLSRSAAFVCTENRCSLPRFNKDAIF